MPREVTSRVSLPEWLIEQRGGIWPQAWQTLNASGTCFCCSHPRTYGILRTTVHTASFLVLILIAGLIAACNGGQAPDSTHSRTPELPTRAFATVTATTVAEATASTSVHTATTGVPEIKVTSPVATAIASTGTATPTTEVSEIRVTSELVTNASFPVAMAFAPDGRLFYNEFLSGKIMVFNDGRTSTFAELDILSLGECGLIGLAIDPDYLLNRYVYVYLIEPVLGRDDIGHPVIMRFTDVAGRGADPTVLVGDLPNTNPLVCGHVSGNLVFGPDGYLYFTVGEMEYKDPSQDLSSPLGKIHRIDKTDGSAAQGNPFESVEDADQRIFAYGLRNTFDFTFNPETGKIYAPENGLGNCDELNIIEMEQNYGHPASSFVEERPPCLEREGVTPIYLYSRPGMSPETFTSNVAPTGVHFVSGEVYPTLGSSLLSCEWNTGYMRRLLLDGQDSDQVIDDSVVVEDCRLDITADAEGIIYYSNTGEIRRLLPSGNAP